MKLQIKGMKPGACDKSDDEMLRNQPPLQTQRPLIGNSRARPATTFSSLSDTLLLTYAPKKTPTST